LPAQRSCAEVSRHPAIVAAERDYFIALLKKERGVTHQMASQLIDTHGTVWPVGPDGNHAKT